MSKSPQDPAATSPLSVVVTRKWYQLRWQILLLVPLALLIVGGIFVPRQLRQRGAIAKLKEYGAVVRTQPVALFGAELLVPPEYADEVVEVYWRDPELNEQKLAVLRGLASVEKLELSGSKVTSQGLKHLASLSRLYMLHLDGTEVGDDGLSQLAKMSGLAVLSLDETQVTDAGLAQLAKMPNLERLYLNGTKVTDAGLAHLGKLSKLKELSLVNTAISDTGLVHLKGLKSLEMLKVYDTRVTQQGMNELHAALPKCVVWVPTQ